MTQEAGWSAVIVEIASRYASALLDQWRIVLAVALGIAIACLPATRRLVSNRPRAIQRGALALVAALGVHLAWSLCWASDDAYVSFRYARNLVRGNGLVFNPGERVEGYTDFLWTMISALFIRLGVHPARAGILLSLVSFVVLIGLSARLTARLSPRCDLPLGLAPLLVAVSYTITSFATSALEPVFATLLVMFALERAEARRPLEAGVLGILATLSHPDHALFYAGLGGAIMIDRERRSEILRYGLPFACVFAPYFLWRWSYYGDLMPNTYYAKSADKVYVEQGLIYFWLSFFGGGIWAVLPLSALGLFQARRSLSARFTLLALPLYVAYTIKIGGDFMLGRLYTPVLVLCFVFADVGLRALIATAAWWKGAALGALAACAAVPVAIVHPGEMFHGVADERTFSGVTDFARMEISAPGRDFGRALHRVFRTHGLHPRVGVFSLGMVSYEADLPVFDMRGLTSRSVAHMPIVSRGRPGHEKEASPGHLLAAGVDMAEIAVYPEPYAALTAGRIESFDLYLSRYDSRWVRALRRAGTLADFPRHIDSAIASLGRSGPERMACDLWQMREYYFSRNPDRTRARAVAAAAVRAQPDLAGVESLLLESRDLASLGFTRLSAFSFGPAEAAWQAAGDGARFGRTTAAPEQHLVFGNVGPFVNTFTRHEHDAAQGVLTSPVFVLRGDVLSFRIGGGLEQDRLSFSLLVDGRVVRSASGCGAEWLGDRVWDIRAFRGRAAQLVIGDTSSEPWGHLLVDEIVEWLAPATTPSADALLFVGPEQQRVAATRDR